MTELPTGSMISGENKQKEQRSKEEMGRMRNDRNVKQKLSAECAVQLTE